MQHHQMLSDGRAHRRHGVPRANAFRIAAQPQMPAVRLFGRVPSRLTGTNNGQTEVSRLKYQWRSYGAESGPVQSPAISTSLTSLVNHRAVSGAMILFRIAGSGSVIPAGMTP